MTAIPNQVINPATEVILANQPKTLPEPALTPMYAKQANSEQKMMLMTGMPPRVVFEKILGALPAIERPYKARELVYRSLDAADHADVKRQALIT